MNTATQQATFVSTAISAINLFIPRRKGQAHPAGTIPRRGGGAAVDTSDARTDADLIAAAASGDEAAFPVLYHRHRDWVAALALRFTRDEHLALDVLQETFVFLAGRIPTLTLTAKLTTYLYPIVRSTAANQLRKRGREVPLGGAGADGLDDVSLPASSSGGAGRTGTGGPFAGSSCAESSEQIDALRRAVDGLPVPHRETLLMRFVSDMSLSDISIALGVPLGTVKSRLHNAIRTLQQALGTTPGAGDSDPRAARRDL